MTFCNIWNLLYKYGDEIDQQRLNMLLPINQYIFPESYLGEKSLVPVRLESMFCACCTDELMVNSYTHKTKPKPQNKHIFVMLVSFSAYQKNNSHLPENTDLKDKTPDTCFIENNRNL